MKLVASLALLATLLGCATLQRPGGEAATVPSTRHLLFSEAAPDKATVSVTRDSGFAGSDCPTTLFVNGKMAALVKAGETVTLYLPQEPVTLGAIPFGVCGGGLAHLEIHPSSAEPTRYRIGPDGDGEIDFYPIVSR
ncbi:hypothetical protein [Polaromonas sp. LjRoot131]|uniref:hypothetical protein n=1 Tax=Polaromonas sp. LjRoot131 TaxID=3342262 RepID=UPI003ECF9963